MEQETDYILREVKRLTLFISKLISKVSTLDGDEIENGIKETDDLMRKEWNLSFEEIITLTNAEFIVKLKKLPEVHLEKLAELLAEITKKINTSELETGYDTKEIANKGLILIKSINKKAKTFSIKRMETNKIFEQIVN